MRAALNLKGLDHTYIPYMSRKGETRTPDFLALNRQGLVPALEREDGKVLTQSLAIIEWLDETHPEPPLLPADADRRARVRALATMIACDDETGKFCHGEVPSLADVCLYAQVWNNRRFDIDTATWPTIARIFAQLDVILAFHNAASSKQPDAA